MKTTWTTCRPCRRKLATWFAATCSASLMLVVCFFWVDTQASMLLLATMSLIIALFESVLVRTRFDYNDLMIRCRYFRTVERNWHDANGWSYLSHAGRLSLYIRFNDGIVVGSNQWILTRSEIMELIPLLMEKIGEPERLQPILPWPYSFLASRPPTEPTNAG